jgi:hypothetical protein
VRNKTLLIGIVLGLTISLTIGGFAAMYTQSAYAIRGITGAGEGPGNGFHPGPANTPRHPPITGAGEGPGHGSKAPSECFRFVPNQGIPSECFAK